MGAEPGPDSKNAVLPSYLSYPPLATRSGDPVGPPRIPALASPNWMVKMRQNSRERHNGNRWER